ncbi:MAG: anti-sigma factor antagonist [Actinomycetota bacterium]|nr:anti-sigma factor antagonist [Actinomycetota bacterium]
MAEFNAQVRDRGGAAVLDLHGDLDGRADAALNGAYADAAGTTAVVPLVLNFKDVGYINSTGIALIVGLLAKARAEARSIRVVGLSEHYRHIFEITRLADFMSFFPDEETAVGAPAPLV